MTLDHLRKEIRQEAQRMRKEALKEAQGESERIVTEAAHQAKALLESSREKAEDEASLKLSQVSATRLEAKKRIAEARDELVAHALAEVREALVDFADSSKYDAVLKDLASSGAGALGGKVRILARKKDLPKLKKWGYSDLEELNCWGGCIVVTTDGRIRMNQTFEALYEQALENLRQGIFEEL